jgi:hypothetical protein
VGKAYNATINNCSFIGGVQAGSTYAGGFVGMLLDSDISSSRALAGVTSTHDIIGGFAGHLENTNTLTNCYAIGGVNSSKEYSTQKVGGFIGQIGSSKNTLTNCYSSQYVYGYKKNGKQETGAFVGQLTYKATFNNCIYDSEITPGMAVIGSNPKNVIGAINPSTTKQIYSSLGITD